jgi:hypothetical protein
VVVSADMPAALRDVVFAKAVEALAAHKVEKDQAQHVKKALEAHNGGLWHVVIGGAFGASVAHETHHFVLFRVGKVHVLAFQSFDEASLVRAAGAAPTAHVARPVADGKRAEDDEEEA